MAWHGMAWHGMPWHGMACHGMACHAMPCHAMACHGMPWHAMACHAMACHAMPCHAMAWHAMPCHGMPWHDMVWHTLASLKTQESLDCRLISSFHYFELNLCNRPRLLVCRGASRQRYAGGRADSVMPGGGPTALCPDSVMPSQRYALPRLEGTYRTYRPTYAK